MSEQEFQDHLTALEKKYAGKTVIADYFQLGMEAKRFSRDLKKSIRTNLPVEMSHISAINGQWANCGKLYEVNEEKTAEWHEKLHAHKTSLEKRDKAQRLGAKRLSEALTEMSDGTSTDDDKSGEAPQENASGKSKSKKGKSGEAPQE